MTYCGPSSSYTICPGTDAPSCVLYNHCEEMQEMDGSKFMHLETRLLSTNGKFLGEASDKSRIPFFRGAKRIELLPVYPLQYHPNRERVARELTQCGRRFVSLIRAHHRQYVGMAFYVDKEGEIVKRHVKGRIMVDRHLFSGTKSEPSSAARPQRETKTLRHRTR